MKKLFTLLFATAMVSVSFAQYNGGGRHDNGNDKVIIIKDTKGYDKYPKDSYSFSKREMDFQIQKINQEFDFKIQVVKNKYFMSRWQKKSQISMLENQRQMEISKVVARFKHSKNRDFGYGNDSRKNW